jgi:hypothetical protein
VQSLNKEEKALFFPLKSICPSKSSPYKRDITLPFILHFFDIVNVPIPELELGVKLSLKDKVYPLLMLGVLVSADNVFQLPLSIRYSQSLVDNFAVKPSSNASMVKYSLE